MLNSVGAAIKPPPSYPAAVLRVKTSDGTTVQCIVDRAAKEIAQKNLYTPIASIIQQTGTLATITFQGSQAASLDCSFENLDDMCKAVCTKFPQSLGFLREANFCSVLMPNDLYPNPKVRPKRIGGPAPVLPHDCKC